MGVTQEMADGFLLFAVMETSHVDHLWKLIYHGY